MNVGKLPPNFGEVQKTRVPFGDRLSGLCAMELSAAHGDPERIGEMIERLSNSLAFTIAIGSQGDARGMNEMLSGVESYLYEAAASHAKVGQFMGQEEPRKSTR